MVGEKILSYDLQQTLCKSHNYNDGIIKLQRKKKAKRSKVEVDRRHASKKGKNVDAPASSDSAL